MAAQSARDRKKVKMQDLEEDVAILSKEVISQIINRFELRLSHTISELFASI